MMLTALQMQCQASYIEQYFLYPAISEHFWITLQIILLIHWEINVPKHNNLHFLEHLVGSYVLKAKYGPRKSPSESLSFFMKTRSPFTCRKNKFCRQKIGRRREECIRKPRVIEPLLLITRLGGSILG